MEQVIKQYSAIYQSPIGNIYLVADETGLTGLWFEKDKICTESLEKEYRNGYPTVFEEGKKWLDIYFSGKEPDFMPPVHMEGTPFQMRVWKILLQIPFGKTMTYGDLAKIIAKEQGISRMSAQAVGGAVGRNKISIIVPCHRVVGSGGNLTGYGGGIEKKEKLLAIEGVDMEKFFLPVKK